MSSSRWIQVDSYEDVPTGVWLVKVDERREGVSPYHVAESHPDLPSIGGHFAFDMPRVIAYRPLGELFEDNGH